MNFISLAQRVAGNSLFSADYGWGDIGGRKVFNWRYRLFVTGSVVGLISAVAAIVFNSMPFFFLGSFLFGMGALSAFTAKKMEALKAYQAYNEELEGRLKEMNTIISGVRDENNRLRKVADRFQGLPDDFKEIFEKDKKEMEAKNSEIAALGRKLDISLRRMQKISRAADDMGRQTELFSKTVLELARQNDLFGESEKELEKQVDEIETHKSELSKSVDLMDERNEELEVINVTFAKRIETLQQVFSLMGRIQEKSKNRIVDLQKQVDEFEEVAKAVRKSTEKLQSLEKKFVMVESRIEKKMRQWREIKESEDYREFKRWKNDRKNRD